MNEPERKTIPQLIGSKRIAITDRENMEHLIGVLTHATTIGAFDELTRMLNYVAPLDDNTVILYRDGRPEEYSFFWVSVDREEYEESVAKATVYGTFREDLFQLPKRERQRYHGGLIFRPDGSGDDKPTWSVHT